MKIDITTPDGKKLWYDSEEEKRLSIISNAEKFIEDNILVHKYLKGEVTRDNLDKKGIKLYRENENKPL